ncbi:MAG: fibro-slime domain-containing protein [Fibromonadaceae bacterium]|jgi:fibro-slime domain-containing protein|nr:fibro-slime domain-containing protein [Fibromonadaceae bacterium]
MNKVHKLTLAAGLALALAFTLSCSSDNDDSEKCRICDPPENTSAEPMLDVIYRDFPITAPGFEEFLTCDGTAICFSGDKYEFCPPGTNLNDRNRVLHYGEWWFNGTTRGYINGPDASEVLNLAWAVPVTVTTGMVQPTLYYDKSNCPEEWIVEDPDGLNRDYMIYRYCVRPIEGNGGCGSEGLLESWFSDGGYAKRIDGIIQFERQDDGGHLIDYGFNTCTHWVPGLQCDNGFFPLDEFDMYSSDNTWGRQSLNAWCPPADQSDSQICSAWHAAGGPKHPTAAQTVANELGIQHKLHNYGFSMASSSIFKYIENSGEVLEFISGDDMWVFIDGQLAVDLGGVHVAAPAKINLEEYAKKLGPWASRAGEVWQSGTTHSINVFYMNRQTEGSDFKLKIPILHLAPSRFGCCE